MQKGVMLQRLNKVVQKPKPIRPYFYYGFEFEGFVYFPNYNEFRMDLRAINPYITFCNDSSIRNVPEEYISIEFCTPKLEKAKALKLLEDILDYLQHATESGVFGTNKSCGFHINVSEKNIFTPNGPLYGKQLEYYSHILTDFDEDRMLKLFGRRNNTYCRQFKKTNKANDFNSIYARVNYLDTVQKLGSVRYYSRTPLNKKYYAVALRENPSNEYDYNHRIEFRFIGNKDYQQRTKDLTDSVEYITTILNNSFQKVSQTSCV